MLNQLFRDTFVYGIATLFSRGIAMLLIPVYTYAFSPTEYGIIDFLILIGTLMNIIVALEISQGVARHYADSTNIEDKINYSSSAFWFTVVVYTIFFVVFLQFSGPLSIFLFDTVDAKKVFCAAVLSTAANGIFYHIQNQLRWEFKATAFALASGLYTVVSAIFAVYLIFIIKTGPASVFYGQIAGACVGGILGVSLARNSFRFRFVWTQWFEMIRFSTPLVASSVAVYLSIFIDRFFLKELISLAAVGIYGVGYRIASIVGLLMAGFQGAVTPLVYQYYKKSSTPNDLAKLLRYFAVAVLPLTMIIAVFAREITTLITTPSYIEAWRVVPILTFGILFANMYIFAPGLFIAKKTFWVAIINISAALLNGFLNLSLIPLWGISGAAIATSFTALISFIVFMVLSQKIYPAPHDWWKILSTTFLVIFIIIICLLYPVTNKFAVPGLLYKLVFLSAGVCIIAIFLLSGEERIAIKMKFLRTVRKV